MMRVVKDVCLEVHTHMQALAYRAHSHLVVPNTQWRGGGVAHGPKPRSHAHKLLKKVRRLGIKCALSAKAFEKRLLVVDSLKPPEPKTVCVYVCVFAHLGTINVG